ncbi:MAG: hypothetical protein D6714_12885, partial [Bacteroidetes bacterium]
QITDFQYFTTSRTGVFIPQKTFPSLACPVRHTSRRLILGMSFFFKRKDTPEKATTAPAKPPPPGRKRGLFFPLKTKPL